MENFLQEYNIDHWLVKFIVIILVIITINISTRIILNYLKKQSKKTSNVWDDCVINSFYRPFTILVWILGIVFTLEAFNKDFKVINISHEFLVNLKRAGIIFSIALFLNNLSRNYNRFSNLDLVIILGKSYRMVFPIFYSFMALKWVKS